MGSAFAVQIANNGYVLPDPAVQVDIKAGVPVIMRGYLPILNYLYGAIGSATSRLGTKQADVFKARQDEVAERKKLYEFYQSELASFIDIPINPMSKGGKRAYGQIVL